MIRAVSLSAFLLVASLGAAGAQQSARVVATCGSAGYSAGGAGQLTIDVNGNLCSNGGGGTPTSVTPKPTTGTGAYSAATIGTSDSTILAASTATVFLDVVNTSATATVCLNLGATATITGTQCAAGEIALPPLWHRSWENNFVPTDAVHAIASAASTQAALGVK